MYAACYTAIMDPIRNKPQLDDSISVSGGPPKQRKLTYQDLQGYRQWVEAFKDSPEDYADHIPNTPVVDASQWIEANFKDVSVFEGIATVFMLLRDSL